MELDIIVCVKYKFVIADWMYCGMAAGVVFIILQLLFLVDFTYAWNATWFVLLIFHNAFVLCAWLVGRTF